MLLWWVKQAKEKYPEMPYPEDWFVEDLYKSQDSSKLNDYHKWAFYIDQKYLKAETSGGVKKILFIPLIIQPILIR